MKKVCGQVDRVKCEQCSSEFSVSHGGCSDIKGHIKCAKHKASLTAAASSSKISFFKSADPVYKDRLIAAKEATFAFHTAVNDLSFTTADCSAKLISLSSLNQSLVLLERSVRLSF
jgi:hydrogenase maturation factor